MSVMNQIRPNITLGLIWFKTVCKGYQQTTKVAASKECYNMEQFCKSDLSVNLITPYMLCNFACFFLSFADFFFQVIDRRQKL